MTGPQLRDHMSTGHNHHYYYHPDKATLEDDHGRSHASVPLVSHTHHEGELTKSAVVGMLAAGRELLNRAEMDMGPRRSTKTGLDGVLDRLDAVIVAYEPSAERYDRSSPAVGAAPTPGR